MNTIYCCDSIELMKSWKAGAVDLVFADPPYNIGYIYDKYTDDRPDDEYVAWSKAWMEQCRKLLTPTGSFYLAIGDEFAAQLCMAARELGMHLRNWIIWQYNFGQNMRTKFSRAHTHILYFTKHADDCTFNDHLLRFPSARHTEYQDLRANPRGRLPSDVWDEFPRVCGTFKERDGYHGCQLPEGLLARIIMASSNPGEVVLDPFVGSGTTAAVAKRLGRKYVGIDLSEEYVARTNKRLAGVRDESEVRPTDDGAWPALHKEFLAQLYRETKVIYDNLIPNEVALRVIAASLSQRAGCEYDVDAVREQFERMRKANELPKLPNDQRFVARNHVKKEGKKYVRKVLRYRARERSDENSPEARVSSG